MRIDRVTVAPFEPRFAGGSFAMGHVSQDVLYARLVALHLEDGSRIVTEICRAPTLDHAALAIEEDNLLQPLAGSQMSDLPQRAKQIMAGRPDLAGLAAALDLAVLQHSGLRAGLPLWVLLGGAQQEAVPEIAAHGMMAPSDLFDAIDSAHSAAPIVQIKLGCGDIRQDLAATRAALEAMWPDQRLLADFNGKLSVDEALEHLPELSDPRLVWEEPCTRYEDVLRVAQGLETPVLFDQCLTGPEVYARAAQDGVAYVAIKPARLGGLGAARAARDICTAARIRMRVDGPWSGPIWAAANLHLALGIPSDLMMGAMDTSAPLELDPRPDFGAGPGLLAPPNGPGLGHGLLNTDERLAP